MFLADFPQVRYPRIGLCRNDKVIRMLDDPEQTQILLRPIAREIVSSLVGPPKI